MPIGHVGPEIALLIGAALTLLYALVVPHRWQGRCAVLALLTLGVTAVLVVDQLDLPQQLTFSGTWALDGAAHWAELAILGATAVVVGLSPEWFATDQRHGEVYVLLLLSALGAVMMASAADTMELVLGVLLASVTGYALAAFHRRSKLATEAGIKYFLVGGLTNALLLVGVVLLFGLVGTTGYEETQRELLTAAADPLALVAVAALVAVGLAFKLGAVPAHAWMPDVAQGSPAPSAAFLTVVPKLGALVGLARLLSLLPADAVGWRPLAALLAAATMTLGNLAAMWQDDLRRLLGWSAVSQSGYGLMALVAIDRAGLGLPALLLFLFAYAAANLAAFGVVVELRGRTNLADYAGLGHARPLLGAALAVALLSLVGIPPLAGFAAKLLLFGAAIEAGYGWLAALAVANTVVSLFYYLRVLGPMYLEPRPLAAVPVLGWSARTATVASAAAVVALGLGAEPLLRGFGQAQLLP